MDIEIAADILTENCSHLADAKSHGLIHMLIWKAIQTGKCWDDMKDILRLKLCYTNINKYQYLYFIEIHKKDNETLAAYIQHFKTAAKQCTFNNNTVAICILLKDFEMDLSLWLK